MISPVTVDIANGLATITLNRADRANAIDLVMAQSLSEATIGLTALRGLRCVMLRSSGPIFCAGGDLLSFDLERLPIEVGLVTDHLHAAISRLRRLEVPLVAAVQGPAAGAGLGLALACDVIIASTSARFVYAYTRVGLSADAGCSFFLPRVMSTEAVLRMTASDKPMSAQEAWECGMVVALLGEDEFEPGCDALAMILAKVGALYCPPRQDNGLDAHLATEAANLIQAAGSPEAKALITAFRDRSRPSPSANAAIVEGASKTKT